MKIKNLTQPPFNTTLMGVVKGALNYYQIKLSDASVFGESGHAFLINIHTQICPSGPYCWKGEAAKRLIRNIGLQIDDLGFFSVQSSPKDRALVEEKLRAALDSGMACSLVNMENQLITGYNDTGFFTAQPWACNTKFPPDRLTYGSWAELGKEIHITFYTIAAVKPVDRGKAILDSLDYAVDLHTHPSRYCMDGYGIGPDAYTNWINAAAEFGASHGNWWNATVWSECRRMASAYLAEIGQAYACVAQPASELSVIYGGIADALGRLSDKAMDTKDKTKLLAETKQKEAEAINKVAALAAVLRASIRAD